MLPTAENATAADGKEAGVPFVFPPRPSSLAPGVRDDPSQVMRLPML